MLKLTLPIMTCGHCVSVVTKAIKQTDPRALLEIDLASHRERVQTTEDRETIASAVAEAGYVPDRKTGASDRHAPDRWVR